MVDSIKADVDGLFALGAGCMHVAEALSPDRAAPQRGPNFQTTTAAIDGVALMADRANNLICMRLRVTGHAIVDAGSNWRIATTHPASESLQLLTNTRCGDDGRIDRLPDAQSDTRLGR